MFRVVYEKRVSKDLDKIPNNIVRKILTIFNELSVNPMPIGSKKLSGKDAFYRIRQGDYRIVYLIDYKKKLVQIVLIVHRKDVYRQI
jgi:mRNA interferase RelE/StbE